MSHATEPQKTAEVETTEIAEQTEPTTDEIRQRAYEIYLSRNGEPGDAVQNWLQAELELRSRKV